MPTPQTHGVLQTTARPRWTLVEWFGLTGATAGLAAGLIEAAILRRIPHVPTLYEPDVSAIVWFIAPLAGMALFGLLGILAGIAAGGRTVLDVRRFICASALLIGAFACYAAIAVGWFHFREGNLYTRGNLTTPVLTFLFVSVATALAARLGRVRLARHFSQPTGYPPRAARLAILAAGGAALIGAVFYPTHRLRPPSHAQTGPDLPLGAPNIVLISLDTARADHFSAYGYSRPTTPNIDRLAAQGVLFEKAMAPTPWTLASHISMFTGLLPHQHGANWATPADTRFKTVAELLKPHGYSTAGFTANLYYGQAGWGMSQGFDTYDDNSCSRWDNLAATTVGRAVLQPLYQHLLRYDFYNRRSARDLNQDIFRWLEKGAHRPYFLFINYFDAHDPYLTGTHFDQRFGRITPKVVRRVNSIDGVRIREPLPPDEQASLIAGYDNCLAFLDDEVGQLVRHLSESPEWPRTVVIITSDHGEGFGEHGHYGHGWNLNLEVLHVPLIFVGAGIPAGLRIAHLAGIRRLFPTILDLALGERLPLHQASLRRFWSPDYGAQPEADAVVSEVMENTPEPEPPATISILTAEWHYITKRSGKVELYNWAQDPQERFDLAGSGRQETLQLMRSLLEEKIRFSVKPWRGASYLFALDWPGHSFLRDVAFEATPMVPGPEIHRVGATQSLFAPDEPSARRLPVVPDEDVIRSLPYQ